MGNFRYAIIVNDYSTMWSVVRLISKTPHVYKWMSEDSLRIQTSQFLTIL